ncbi:hypothetical protein GYMLUDRAFT_598504 [Collybiopsis luxurians FD-317 M1]|uniref:Uncharacterized protein n=1 Tax=Collybiopsis luxurians FD-317 M1 TaxID=944289 RepID=A0A0D0BYP3_9AGAR|nr:hypothetical protein GYMLUDRAFT_598504 [Collybiopsis luxurians FD-317 M1]
MPTDCTSPFVFIFLDFMSANSLKDGQLFKRGPTRYTSKGNLNLSFFMLSFSLFGCNFGCCACHLKTRRGHLCGSVPTLSYWLKALFIAVYMSGYKK